MNDSTTHLSRLEEEDGFGSSPHEYAETHEGEEPEIRRGSERATSGGWASAISESLVKSLTVSEDVVEPGVPSTTLDDFLRDGNGSTGVDVGVGVGERGTPEESSGVCVCVCVRARPHACACACVCTGRICEARSRLTSKAGTIYHRWY